MRSPRFWWKLGGLAFLIHFAILLPSVAPSVPGGHDSGEVLSCALLLGIPHPPGYPLYCMLGHLFAMLPIPGELAYRLNVFSAVSLSLAVGVLAVAFGRANRAPAAGMAAALMFGFAFSVWRQGVGAEVFALHLLFVALLLLGCVLWAEASDRGRRKAMLFGCIVFGLAAAHHHTIALVGLGLPVWFVLTRGKGRAWGLSWIAVLSLLFFGLAPYSYLYIRAKQDCPMNWSNPDNYKDWKDHILRKGYGTGRLNPASGTVVRAGNAQAIAYYASVVRNQYPFPLFLIAVAGVLLAIRSHRDLLWLYGWIFVINGPAFSLYSDQPPIEFFLDMVERFYCTSYLGIAGFISLGLGWVEHRLRETRRPYLAWLLPTLALYSVLMNWSACSQRGQWQPHDHMAAILNYVPKGTLLCIDGDLPAGEYDYLNYVLKRRPDVIGVFPGLLAAPWYQEYWVKQPALIEGMNRRMAEAYHQGKRIKHLQGLVDEARAQGIPVYCTTDFAEAPDGKYLLEGLVFRYYAKAEKLPDQEQRAETARRVFQFLENSPKRGNYRLSLREQTFWTRYVIGQWVRGYRHAALDLYSKYPALAEAALRRAMEMDPYRAKDWVNLALLYMDRRDWKAADEALDQALKIEPEMPLALGAKVDLNRSKGDTARADEWKARYDARIKRGF